VEIHLARFAAEPGEVGCGVVFRRVADDEGRMPGPVFLHPSVDLDGDPPIYWFSPDGFPEGRLHHAGFNFAALPLFSQEVPKPLQLSAVHSDTPRMSFRPPRLAVWLHKRIFDNGTRSC